jgi:hypothetical protein
MKTLRMFAAFALVAMSLFAVSAEAQEISVLFGDEMASSKQVKLFEAFKISIVVSNIDDTIGAVEYKLNLPENVAVTRTDFWPDALDLSGPDGTALALGECVIMVDAPNIDQAITVATIEAIAVNTFASTEVTLTEFTGTPANPATAPRYANCQDQLVNLTPVDGVLQGVTVDTEASSFSKVKALF